MCPFHHSFPGDYRINYFYTICLLLFAVRLLPPNFTLLAFTLAGASWYFKIQMLFYWKSIRP